MLQVQTNIDGETIVIVQDELLKVELANIGEGYFGDYEENNPDDKELIRFYVDVFNGEEWEYVEDSSCCTCIPVDTDINILVEKAKSIHKAFKDKIDEYPVNFSVKSIAEQLSWMK
jgi:hypothetical protein